jgi:hypothetical protein
MISSFLKVEFREVVDGVLFEISKARCGFCNDIISFHYQHALYALHHINFRIEKFAPLRQLTFDYPRAPHIVVVISVFSDICCFASSPLLLARSRKTCMLIDDVQSINARHHVIVCRAIGIGELNINGLTTT